MNQTNRYMLTCDKDFLGNQTEAHQAEEQHANQSGEFVTYSAKELHIVYNFKS